jgi:glycosyltransferase involved in cell wall biosynthesis
VPRVHQVLASLGYGDAIGNSVLGIRRVLRAAGVESRIYVETADPRLEDETSDYRDMVDEVEEGDLLLHHFSLGSRASRTAYALPCRMMLMYHNITPPEYFVGVHPWLVRQCYHGRRELGAYASRVSLAAGASEFNRRELEALGFPNTAVLPVVPDFSHLGGPPNRRVLDAFDDDRTNILFVGRMIPNKRPDQLIRFFHAYQSMVNPDARLLLAGSSVQFEHYRASLQYLAAELGVRDIHFLGQVSNEELTALYDVADLYLCASEHEGFCVPLVEAFYKRVPVLAYAATAVPATMDGGGVLFDSTDPVRVAATMAAMLADEATEDRILATQDDALARLQAIDFPAVLLRYVHQALAAPMPDVKVAADFWRQYKLALELDEIREARPSAFHALPADDESRTATADVEHRG